MSTLGMSFQDVTEQIDEAIKNKLSEGEELNIIYSAYDLDERDIPINNLNEVPVEGKIKFVEGEFESEVMDSPTWLDIAIVANKMISKTRDFQNKYFEDFNVEKLGEDDNYTATFVMNSY